MTTARRMMRVEKFCGGRRMRQGQGMPREGCTSTRGGERRTPRRDSASSRLRGPKPAPPSRAQRREGMRARLRIALGAKTAF